VTGSDSVLSVVNLQEAYVTALLIDRAALASAQRGALHSIG
jgi:L-rhamnose isomerase